MRALPRQHVRQMASDLLREGYGGDSLHAALAEIVCERHKQDSKWGEQNHTSEVWHIVASEELGEAAEAILDLRSRAWERPASPPESEYRDLLRYEVVQLAAVAVAWIEYLDRHPSEPVTDSAKSHKAGRD